MGRWEREISQLVKERRLLQKAWRKAEGEEKEGLQSLWRQLRGRLAQLRQAEWIRKHSSCKEKARASFFRDPFKYARGLLEEKKSGTLQTSEQELEEHIKEPPRESPLGSPGYVPRSPEPTTPL